MGDVDTEEGSNVEIVEQHCDDIVYITITAMSTQHRVLDINDLTEYLMGTL